MSGSSAFKLFVGNLPWTVSRRELSAYFSKFGGLRSVSVVFNQNTGLSKGFGFVEFTNKEGYNSAVAHDHHVLENSKAQAIPMQGSRKYVLPKVHLLEGTVDWLKDVAKKKRL